MRRKSLALYGAGVAMLLGACGPAEAFSATFTWRGIGPCLGVSPAFAIRNAPKGTASLRFEMRDYDAPNFRHGGSTVAYDGGGRIAQGAVSYIGPCPPGSQTHRYIWTIEALDGGGSVVGKTESEGRFPQK